MITVSSTTVSHVPSRRATIIGKVGQNSTRLTTDDMGRGSRCFWLRMYKASVTPRPALKQRDAKLGSAAAMDVPGDGVVEVPFQVEFECRGKVDRSSDTSGTGSSAAKIRGFPKLP